MISLSKSLAAMSSLFSTLTLSVVVFAQTALAQTATEQAPGAAPGDAGTAVAPPSVPLPDAASSIPAPEVAQQAGSILASMLPHDLTPWGMFMQADIVVKAVMVGLAFASLVTWTGMARQELRNSFRKAPRAEEKSLARNG